MGAWTRAKATSLILAASTLAATAVGLAANPPAATPDSSPATMATTQPALQLLPRARLILRETRPNKPARLHQILWEAPDKIRHEMLLPDGSTDPNAVPDIVNGGRTLRSDSRSKLYLIEETRSSVGEISMMVLLASVPDPGSAGAAPVITMKWANDREVPCRLQPREQEVVDGQTLRVFELLRVTDQGEQPFMGEQKVFLYYGQTGGEGEGRGCQRIVFGSGPQRVEAGVDANPTFAGDAFELKGPPGYTDVKQGVFPRLPPEIRAIADRYYQAREAIKQYRMVAYAYHDKAYPRYRNVRDGDRWRLDELRLGAMIEDKEAFPRGDKMALTPAQLQQVLEQACRAEMEVDHTVMEYEGQLAQLGFNYTTADGGQRVRASWVVPFVDAVVWNDPAKQKQAAEQRLKTRWYKQAPRSLVGATADYDLRELGWPAWMGDVLVAPHGWDLGTPPPVYYRLPDQPDRPGLIGIRAVAQCIVRDLWIDPAKDDLCATSQEIYDRAEPWKPDPANWDPIRYYAEHKPDDQVQRTDRSIEEYGRTPEGKWYPLSFKGGGRILLDTSEHPDPTLFDWPINAPKPGQ